MTPRKIFDMAQHRQQGATSQLAVMFHIPSFDPLAKAEVIPAGQVLRQRGARPDSVLYLDSGCVVLGVREANQLRHQLGMLEGPAWVDAAFVLAGKEFSIDMITDSRVRVRRMSL